MDIVSPVMTFDIGTIVPDTSSEKIIIAKAIDNASIYVQDFLSDQFTYYIDQIKKLEESKRNKNISLTSKDCMDLISSYIHYETELKEFNSRYNEKSYIFFDNFYYCLIDEDGSLQYEDNNKNERFMYNHLSSIRKVHKSICNKYDHDIYNHFIIFTNFLITIRNKPFMKSNIIINDNGDINFIK